MILRKFTLIYESLSVNGTKALAVEKIGPRRPMMRKRLIGAPGTNFSPLGKRQYLEREETKLTNTSRPIGPIRPRNSRVH